ncbi:hypothetical protein [Chryseosolibacter indicus]|uniref:Collagen-like protein n=1 Tax=Chryseosolibacter indicus TaxID=2782351 RepID=A0ABS5VMA4_9BACT|nr:hypothetical protein [Chryseosolibacter indicus]MBT1702583.1 hypothetical protein [Chryseosolibacter indicus]
MNKFSKLIKKSSLLLMAAGFTVAVSSCEGDEGPVGPIGPKGDIGETGAAGAKGEAGETAMKKAGYFEGTIKGTRQDGTAFEESFKYEYSDDAVNFLDYASRVAVSGMSIERYRDGNYADYNPYMYISGYFSDNGGNETWIGSDFQIYFGKELSPSKYFRFEADTYENGDSSIEPATFATTNYVYDTTTGKLSFNFNYHDAGQHNSTGNEVTITGKFNSGDSKFYSEIVSRKSN